MTPKKVTSQKLVTFYFCNVSIALNQKLFGVFVVIGAITSAVTVIVAAFCAID